MTQTIRDILQHSKALLLLNNDRADLDAEILLSFVLKKSRSFLHAWPDHVLADVELQHFHELLERRLQYEPIAYITGTKEFWSLELLVTQDTLIPRPETELLVEFALKQFDANANVKIADLGTGSGAIAISIANERANWQVHATDISKESLNIASKNAQRFKLNHIIFNQGNWCNALHDVKFDMILSNPPYIAEDEWMQYALNLKYEPSRALLSGKDGLSDIKIICQTAVNNLKQNGLLVIEHGYTQAESVRQIFTACGYQNITTYFDYAGRERFTVGSFKA